jgi:hypothetical protein
MLTKSTGSLTRLHLDEFGNLLREGEDHIVIPIASCIIVQSLNLLYIPVF